MREWSAVFFLVLAAIGCNNSSDLDYRDVFEGDYIGTRTSTSWSLGGGSSSSTVIDTIVVLAVGDSSLLIDATEIMINPNGEFFEQGMSSVSSYFSVRFFNGDSLETEMNGGGLGGGYHSSFAGRKN